MALASNVLIAIGGSPNINTPGFIPNYPGSLPGGLRADLTVSLKKLSLQHIRECFLGIEMPGAMIEERLIWLQPG